MLWKLTLHSVRWAWKLLIALLFLFAVSIVLIQGGVRYLQTHPDYVQKIVKQQLAYHVNFNKVEVHLATLTPRLSLTTVLITNDALEVKLKQLDIELDLQNSLRNVALRIKTVRLMGVDVYYRSIWGKTLSEPIDIKNLVERLPLQGHYNVIVEASRLHWELPKTATQYIKNELLITHFVISKNPQQAIKIQTSLNWGKLLIDAYLTLPESKVSSFDTMQGYVHLKGNITDNPLLATWFPFLQLKGATEIKAWGKVKQGQLVNLLGTASLEAMSWQDKEDASKLTLQNIKSHWRIIQENDGWHLDLEKAQITRNNSTIIKDARIRLSWIQGHWKAYIDRLYLTPIMSYITQRFPQQVFLSKQGRLKNVHIQWSKTEHFLTAEFSNIGINEKNKAIRIAGIEGKIIVNNNTGTIWINSKNNTLHADTLFSKAIPLQHFVATLTWQKFDSNYLLNIEKLHVQNKDISLQLRGNIWLVEQSSPYVALYAHINDMQVPRIQHYLPLLLSEKLRHWLAGALQAGNIHDTSVVFQGWLKDYPFRHHEGVLEVLTHIKKGKVDYLFDKNWPSVEDITAKIIFSSQGMQLTARHARVLSTESQNLQVDIPSFKAPVVKIKGDLHGVAEDLLQYLTVTQLWRNQQALEVQGHIATHIQLTLPLSDQIKDKRDIAIEVILKENILTFPFLPTPMEQISGKIQVHNLQWSSAHLYAKFFDEVVSLNINSEDTGWSCTAQGKLPLASFAKKYGLNTAKDWISGKAAWKLQWHSKAINRLSSLIVNLDDIKIQLPEPVQLSNTVGKAQQLKIYWQANKVYIAYADKIFANLHLPEISTPLSGHIHFGALNLTQNITPGLLLSGDLLIEQLAVWKKFFTAWEYNNTLTKTANHFPAIQLQLERVIIDDSHQAVQTNKTMLDHATTWDVNPKYIPAMNGYINHFFYGKKEIGKIQLQTEKYKSGINIEKAALIWQDTHVQVSGLWRQLQDQIQTLLWGTINSKDTGKLLEHWGYGKWMKKGLLKIGVNLKWNGMPFVLQKESVSGIVHVDMQNSEMLKMKPGAGRVLGLINLPVLSNRISLDFSNLKNSIKKGLNFEKITGSINIVNGLAKTTNFALHSAIVAIKITGSADIVKKTYNQKWLIIPELSSGITLAGLAAGGPAVGAGVWLLQQFFGEEIKKISRYQYSVQGTWDKPIIKIDWKNTSLLNNSATVDDTVN